MVDALNRAIAQSLATPEVRDAYMKVGSEPMTSTPEGLSKRMSDGIAWFAQVTQIAGIKPQ